MSHASNTNDNFLPTIAFGLSRDDYGDVCPTTDAGCCFVFGVEDEFEPHDFERKPTATLVKDTKAIHIWAFDAPADPKDARLNALVEFFEMQGVEDCIPHPGYRDWKLVEKNEAPRYSLDELHAAYVALALEGGLTEGNESEAGVASEASVAEPGDTMEPKLYGDATIITPYNEAEYGKEIVITFGGNRQSKRWVPKSIPAGAFMATLSRSKEGEKDGTAFVLGDMVPGQRLKTSVKSLHGVGLDIDTGTPTATVDAALKKLGCVAVRYSTHSSGKTKTEIKKDKVMKFAGDREIDQELIRYFLREVERWDMTVVDNAEYIGTEHTEQGIVCQITHPPMPKHRIVMLFKEPFEIGKEGQTQAEAMKKWAKVPEALARLLNVPFDTSCTDPSRLFYLPRHAKGKPFGISLFGGSYFDWRTLELDDPMEKLNAAISKGKSKSVTEEGRELGRWHLKRGHGFQIADVIEAHTPDRIRHNTGRGFEIECPFDEDHSNFGDTEDRACLVVNAGEGPGEFFTISCRHETCRDKTFLDMLGKMLKDKWFDKAVLEDEQFNAILEDEDEPQVSVKIKTEDEARAAYEIAIAALTPDSSQEQLEAAVALVIEANLLSAPFARAQDVIGKNRKLNKPVVQDTFKEMKRKLSKGSKSKPPARAPKGQTIFNYDGDYNFDEACDEVIKAVLAENALRKKPVICAMDGVMVRMGTSAGGSLEFLPLSYQDFWAYALKLIVFVKGDDGVREKVPEDVARACHANCRDWLPEAPEVVDAPLFLSDGSLLEIEGYHYSAKENLNHLLRLTRLPGAVKVSRKPTEAEAMAAARYLKSEILVDFPFLDADNEGKERREPAEANAVAMIVTPFMRRMIKGCTPVFCIMKPDPGTGSTLLAGVSPMTFDGKLPVFLPYTSDPSEMGKNIVASIQTPQSHMIFDNVSDFNNPEIVRAVTAPYVSGRLLGANQIISRPNTFNWIVTGINPIVRSEMERRIVWIRMNAEGRSSDDYPFRHPTVSGHAFNDFVLEHRHIIIGHILTMIQYWVNLGEPLFNARRRASFEDWSAKVGGVLEACGVEGFLDNKKFTIQDREKLAWAQIANRFYKRHGTGRSNAVTEDAIYDLASNPAVSIINGYNDDSKRANFTNRLPGFVGKTFEFVTKDTTKEWFKVKCEPDKSGEPVYWFEIVHKGNA